MKTLHIEKFRSFTAAALLCAGLCLASASFLAVRAKGDNGAPDLPSRLRKHRGAWRETDLSPCLRGGRAKLQMERRQLGVCGASGDLVLRPNYT